MYKVLQGIPGAEIEQNALVSYRGIGRLTLDFKVTLVPNPAIAREGTLASLLDGIAFRSFVVYRDVNGYLCIGINQDQLSYRSVESLVEGALGSAEQHDRRIEEEHDIKQEFVRLQEAQKAEREKNSPRGDARFVEEHRRTSELENARRSKELLAAREEAERVLQAMDQQRMQSVTHVPSVLSRGDRKTPDDPIVNQIIEQNLSAALAQEYAKEKVLEQLDDIRSQFGVSLGGMETLPDGTIEITLRG